MDDTTRGLLIILFALFPIFLVPLFCMVAWNMWAWEFNLPQTGYWIWFITHLAIRGLFGKWSINFKGDR